MPVNILGLKFTLPLKLRKLTGMDLPQWNTIIYWSYFLNNWGISRWYVNMLLSKGVKLTKTQIFYGVTVAYGQEIHTILPSKMGCFSSRKQIRRIIYDASRIKNSLEAFFDLLCSASRFCCPKAGDLRKYLT